MRSKVLAVCVAAVLGIAGGVITAFALPRHTQDPLHLGIPLVDVGCSPGRSLVMVGWGRPSSVLSSAAASNPGARYLQPSRSCPTAWRYHAPGQPQSRPDPDYVVYLGPYSTGQACQIRMQGSHKGSFVTSLTAGTTDMVQCVCKVDITTAPTLRPGMSIDARESIWIRQLQEMLLDAHLLPSVSGLYDGPTQRVIEAEQGKAGLQQTGVVTGETWHYLTRTLCQHYTP